MTKDKDKKRTYYSSYGGPAGYPSLWTPPSSSNPNRDGDTAPMIPSFDSMQRKLDDYINSLSQLLSSVDEIIGQTGFNTNAPEELFDKARKRFTKLEKSVKVTKKPSVTNELLSLAKWELFQKLDPSESRRVLKRLKATLEKK